MYCQEPSGKVPFLPEAISLEILKTTPTIDFCVPLVRFHMMGFQSQRVT